MEWTPERIETLTRMWRAGHTAREISEFMGNGCTRNSVIGKANRLGLSKPTRSSLTRRQNRQAKEAALSREEPTVVNSPGATILTLTTSCCRWPIGDPGSANFRFCGARANPGQPYCEAHARLAYQPPSHSKARSRTA